MVHFKTAASLFVVVAAVAPILATPIDLTSELEVREPKGFKGLGRIARKVGRFGASAAGALAGRDLEEFELEAREPKAHKQHHKKGGKRHHKHKKAAAASASAAPAEVSTPTAREFDELEVREPKQGHKAHHKKGGKRHHKHKKAAAQVAPTEAETPAARDIEWEDVEAREPKQGRKSHHKKGGKSHHKHKKAPAPEAAPAEAPAAREYEDIDAREPLRPSGGRRTGGTGGPGTGFNVRRPRLAAREPRGMVGGPGRGFPRPPIRGPTGGRGRRDLEDIDSEDLLAREFDDEFDLD